MPEVLLWCGQVVGAETGAILLEDNDVAIHQLIQRLLYRQVILRFSRLLDQVRFHFLQEQTKGCQLKGQV